MSADQKPRLVWLVTTDTRGDTTTACRADLSDAMDELRSQQERWAIKAARVEDHAGRVMWRMR